MNIGNSMTSCAMSPDGKFVAVNSHKQRVVIVDVERNRQFRRLDVAGKTLRFSNNGQLLAIGDTHGDVHVLTFPGLEGICRAQVDERLVDCLDLSPDDRILASAGYDRQLKALDLESNELKVLAPLQAFTCLVRYSPDGQRILTADVNGSVRLWHSESGELLIEWRLPSGWYSGEFSIDGTAIVIGGARTELVIRAPSIEQLRSLSVASLRSQACRDVTFASTRGGR